MKKTLAIGIAALSMVAFGFSALPAAAAPWGNHHRHHQVCKTVWHHHHKHVVCN